jgi:anti-sigma factor RsiW
MKITCREMVELLLDFLDNSLPPEQRAELEHHLRACPPCIAFIESYKLTVQVTRKVCSRPQELPPHLACRLRDALAALEPPPGDASV